MNNLIKIETCEVCKNGSLTPVLDLGLHPICDDLISIQSDRINNEYPVNINYCKTCYTAHHVYQIPKKLLFPSTYHYRARFTKDVIDGMKSLVTSIETSFGSLKNKKVLADYIFDFTTNSIFPKYNKFIHDGIIQTENVADGRGARGKRYKVRITNFVRNLINNDSTNVRLGLSVTENINTIGFAKLKTPNANLSSAPIMSVQSPAGTILYGTSPVVPEGKRLKLKIYYTKPN